MKLTLRMIITLVIITMCSAAVLSGISRWAEPRIEKHALAARQRAILTLHPAAEDSREIAQYGPDDLPIFATRDDAQNTTGYAFTAVGTGYQGEIRLMVGTSPTLDRLTGIVILAQVETPGLGARIGEKTEDPETKEDYKFRNWFQGLKPEPKIEYVRNQIPEQDNQVRAITGATISSESVVEIINEAYPEVKKIITEKENIQPGVSNE